MSDEKTEQLPQAGWAANPPLDHIVRSASEPRIHDGDDVSRVVIARVA